MNSESCSAKELRAQQRFAGSTSAYLAVLFLLSIGLLASLPAPCQQTVDLVGQVVTDTGQAIRSGVTITLETDSGERAAQAFVNTEGRFELPGLRKIPYRLTVTAEGFETWQEELDLSEKSVQYMLKISLTPLKKVKETPAAPTLTDGQAPKAARKEYAKGSRALAARKLDEARAHLENALAEFPCYARAQIDLAVVLTEQHELPGAEAALRKAVQCDPGLPDAYAQLGQLLNAEKKFAESADVLQEGLRRSPGAWQFYYQLAIAQFGLKQYSEAEQQYLKVQSLNPNAPADLCVKLADVYLREGAYDKAYAQMQAYLKAEPNGRFAAKVKTIMQQMESSGALRSPPVQATQPPPS